MSRLATSFAIATECAGRCLRGRSGPSAFAREGRADLLIHLNSDEEAFFRRVLPESRHTLLCPAVAPMPTEPDGSEFVIVASANVANSVSLEWFLREVVPNAGDVPITIYGNIDGAIRDRAPDLYQRYSRHFRGPGKEIRDAYTNAACVLLPCVEGHGLSIKTIEALSSGAPLIASSHAFRGTDLDLNSLPNVVLAYDAWAFAEAMRMRAAIGAIQLRARSAQRASSMTRGSRQKLMRRNSPNLLPRFSNGTNALPCPQASVHAYPTRL